MEQQEEAKPQGSTFAQRLNQSRFDAKKRAIDKKSPDPAQIGLTDKDREFCEKTISLLNNPAYKAMIEYEGQLAANFLGHAYDAPPEAFLKGASFGEQMAFKKGMMMYINYFRVNREHLWQASLAEQEKSAKKTKESTNG